MCFHFCDHNQLDQFYYILPSTTMFIIRIMSSTSSSRGLISSSHSSLSLFLFVLSDSVSLPIDVLVSIPPCLPSAPFPSSVLLCQCHPHDVILIFSLSLFYCLCKCILSPKVSLSSFPLLFNFPSHFFCLTFHPAYQHVLSLPPWRV